MKSLIQTFVLLILPLAAAVTIADGHAPEQGASNDLGQGRDMIREGRLEMVRSELHLTDQEASAFWPVYAAYRDEIDTIQDRYVAMIMEYLRRYDEADLSDEYADELIERFLRIKRELLDVQEKYLPKFRAAIPSLKVARLYQLENKINAEIDSQTALAVPLVDPT